jgi:hypothetical protein
MRDVKRHYISERPKVLLRRAADGRLKPASEELEVADIWAEQKRIRLAQAIAEEQKKLAKKRRRQERRLSRSHIEQAQGATKGIEIRLALPKIDAPDISAIVTRAKSYIPKFSIKQWAWAGAGLVLVVFIVSSQGVYKKADGATQKNTDLSKPTVSGASASAPIGGTKPAYTTILPVGKTIAQLGGWGRVSPPDKNPVFAYSDNISGVHIVVSEQPLPDNFNNDLQNQMAQLARQFNANVRLTTGDGSIIYAGTAITGAQSVVSNKSSLLLLIRSASKVSDPQLINYISTLQ